MKNSNLYLIFILLLCSYQYLFSYNPIDENLEYKPKKIINFNIINDTTGSYNDPGRFYFSFSAVDKKYNNINFYSKINFLIFVGRKRVKNFLFQSSYNAYKIYIPRLPYQNKNGLYDLKIKIISKDKLYFNYNKKKLITYKFPEGGKINLILIIDTSASMYLNDKQNFRRKAIKNIIDSARINKSISKISIIKFSSIAQILCPFTSIHNINILKNAINKIDARGETNIGDALDKAYKELEKAGQKKKTITILLTDGENTAPYNKNHLKFKKLNSPIFTIGLKKNVNNAFLNDIANSTGGQYYKIPDSFKIQDIYLKIVNKEANRKIFISADINLKPYQTTNILFYPDRTIKKLNIFSYWENGNIIITTTPKQKQYDLYKLFNFQSFNLKNLKNKKYFFKIKNISNKQNKISLVGFVNSNLIIKSYLSKTYNYLNEPVELSILAFQDNSPIINSEVYAHIYSPKTNCRIRLHDDGLHNDDKKNDGLYKNYFFNNKPGNYKVIFKIRGKNLYSENFYREKYNNFITDKKENKQLKIVPLNIEFQKVGADIDYYQSFKLLSIYSNNISTKIIPINLFFSNRINENISKKIKIKPDFIILEPNENKLFNINVNFNKNEKNGIYYGNLILTANNDFFNVPLKLNYYKYRIPENSAFIRR